MIMEDKTAPTFQQTYHQVGNGVNTMEAGAGGLKYAVLSKELTAEETRRFSGIGSIGRSDSR